MKKLSKKGGSAEKWSKSSLEALLKEDKQRFYALAVRYGLPVKSETGRWRKTPAVIQEILKAQKEKGYLPAPRDPLPEDYAEKSSKEKTTKADDSEEEEEETTDGAEETEETEKTEKEGEPDDRKALFIGVSTFLASFEQDVVSGLRTIVDKTLTQFARQIGYRLDAKTAEELAAGSLDEDSETMKLAARVGITDGDAVLAAASRIGEIKKED